MKLIWRLAPITVFVLLAVVLWRGLSLDPRELPSTFEGKRLPKIDNPILYNASETLPKTWFLLNVWASWCDACVQEQGFLLKLQRQGIHLYGLNYKDETNDALLWLKNWGNPYERIWQDKAGNTAIDLGVYGSPETFLINKDGIIVYRHAGPLDEAVWSDEFLPRINRL